MTEQEKNQLAKQYMPLVKKIAHQWNEKCALDYEEIEGFGWQGFVLAMNKYDPEKSNMSFKSFAAYGILNSILRGLSHIGASTIHVSYYMRKKMAERSEDVPVSISIEKNFENEDHLAELGFEDDINVDDTWSLLVKRLEENFPKDWVDMFCDEFGLNGHEVVKCKEIAQRLGVSGCLITKRTQKMIDYIKNNEELSDILRELL